MAEPGGIVGREPELATIGAFLELIGSGPIALSIEGEAGIGKTTLWKAAIDAARGSGRRVLSASASEQETKLAFAVLSDLIGGALEEVADRLAPPQRRALEVALLRVESGGVRPDRRAVGLALLAVIRALAEAAPVMLAVDDVQWVDGPSAQALAFAIRRVDEGPIGVISALRLGPGLRDRLELERALPSGSLRHLFVGPLDPSALQRLLRSRSEAGATVSLARRLHEASGGNPFFALELARAVEREGVEPSTGEPLPMPRDLARLLASRILSLPPRTRDLLLAIAAAGRPTERMVRLLGETPADASAALEDGVRHEVIETTGDRVRFTHPLLASTVYAGASSDQRHEAHLRLSRVVQDPIERAWHLALSTDEAGAGVASVLDEAAAIAETRGVPALAAELSELAEKRTPTEDVDAARRRAIETAEWLFEAGDVARANAHMEALAARTPSGPDRAEVIYRMSRFSWNDIRRVRGLIERAEREAGEDPPPALTLKLSRAMGWVEMMGGDLRIGASYHATSIRLAEASGSPVEMALSLTGAAYLDFMRGQASAIPMVRRAASMQADLRGMHLLTSPRRIYGALLMWAGELEAARDELEHDYRRAVELGHLTFAWEALVFLAELEIRTGNWDEAARYAAEGLDIVSEVPQEEAREVHLWSSALIAALRGDATVARAFSLEGLRLAERHEDWFHVLTNGSALGSLELSLGNAAGANAHFAPLVELSERMGIQEPGVFPFLPDEIEALVALGELDRAQELLERLEQQAQARDRALALAGAARCRGLIAAARGDLDGALQWVEAALEQHRRVRQPFDLARTLLVQGQILRRLKRKRPAREVLEQALEVFERLGARLWSDRARAELGRIGGRAPSPSELTPTERQVADLVAQGMTNRAAAAALFMSEHTVRANLKRIYSKLGIASRTELAARLHDEPGSSAHPGASPAPKGTPEGDSPRRG